MKNAKRLLSFVLTVLMLVTSFPLVVLPQTKVEADAATKHVDFTVDFDYPYSDPEEALNAAANESYRPVTDKYNSAVSWRHVTESDTNKEFRKVMESSVADQKYIVLDKDISNTIGYSTWNTIKVTSDKILDLAGHKVTFMDKRNKVDRHGFWTIDEYFQSDESIGFNSQFIEINNGATLTIIDSSEKGTGRMFINGYMINAYKYSIKRYCTRDLFWVNDGNLVIYGGTFQAGRAKQQSDDDPWEKIKTVVGDAVALATDVAGYASPINEATGALKDINFNAETAIKALKGKNGDEDDKNTDASKTDTSTGGTVKKDGVVGNPAKEEKKETPAGETDDKTRNQTVGEKDKKNGDGKENKSNDKGTAKELDANSKIAKGQNAVLNAATNKETIGKMVDSAFKLADSVKSLFTTNADSIVTQSLLGTVVHIGNTGTLVTYGGTFQGYGMTPNVRNAVIESTPEGQAYIFGGTFEGYTGANIFNIVKTNNGTQTFTQYTTNDKGETVANKVTVPPEETGRVEVLTVDQEKFSKGIIENINTSNIRVRGGIFRNYFEYSMCGLHEDDPKKAANNHASKNMTMFPGTAGSINLGVESFDEDLIRDGRIQIVDNYGDGALVLMDEDRAPNDKVNHYRLYCSDAELRLKQYISVYPNESLTNSNYSFSLVTRYGNADTGEEIADMWTDDENNKRAPYSSNEMYFTYPIDNKTSDKYYVVPKISDTDVYGEKLDESDVWYYNTPIAYNRQPITGFVDGATKMYGILKSNDRATTINSKTSNYVTFRDGEKLLKNGSVSYVDSSANYFTTLKWLTYKVYRVDPLTRENITDRYGYDQPILTASYGASAGDALKCRLPIDKIAEYGNIEYKPGEMYRIVLTVDEYARITEMTGSTTIKDLPKASCESSILFLCYGSDETAETEDDIDDIDYTPIQWIKEPTAGEVAEVRFVNAKAGQIDWQTRKMFDVYYQWYAVDPTTGKETMIAGSDNIYDDITLKNYNRQSWEYYTYPSTKYKYLNTKPLPTDTKDWTDEMLHTYPQGSADTKKLTKDGTKNLNLDNNNIYYSNTDTCYIPKEYKGQYIKVKVIAVNNFWPVNYDHRQTFSSHSAYVKGPAVAFVPTVKLTQSGAYISKTNPLKINVNIDPDSYNEKTERVRSVNVSVKLGNRTAVTKLDVSKMDATGKLPTLLFPNDFGDDTYINTFLNGCSNAELKVSASRYKGDTWISTVTSPAQTFNYQVAAESFNVKYSNRYMRSGVYHILNNTAAESFSVEVYPKTASLNYLLIEGKNFTTSDKDVATLSDTGKLVLGGKAGTTTLTIINIDGSKSAYKIIVPVKKVDISEIDAPVLNGSPDMSAVIPENAGYTVKSVKWTDLVTDAVLPATAKFQPYHKYKVDVTVALAAGNEFNVDEYSSDTLTTECPTAITINNADSTTTVFDGTEYADYGVTLNEITVSHTFDALTVDGKTTIDALNIEYAPEVKHGDSVEEWLKTLKIYADCGDALEYEIRPLYSEKGQMAFDALGYNDGIYFKNSKLFIKDYQTGLYINPSFKDGSGINWADNVTVYVNGKVYKTVDTKNESMIMLIGDAIHIGDGENLIQPAPVVENDAVQMVLGETVCLADYIKVEGAGVLTEEIYTQDHPSFDEAIGGYITAKSKTKGNSDGSQNYTNVAVYVPIDVDGDGKADFEKDLYIPVTVYESAPATSIPNAQINISVLDPTGKTVSTKTLTKKATGFYNGYFFDMPTVDNAFVKTVEVSAANEDTVVSIVDGLAELEINYFSGNTTVKLKTVSAQAPEIHAGATGVYMDTDIPSMQYSVDGYIWTTSDQITGLTPETDYVLYYKQGRNGVVYAQQFRTAKVEYASVGRNIITDENLGNLNSDGWHYTPSTKTLTLKNLNLKSRGIAGYEFDILGNMALAHAAIFADHELTIELIGNNTVENTNCNDIVTQLILVNGDLTIKGTGNLTLNLKKDGIFGLRGIYTTGNITLEGPGKLTVNNDYVPRYIGDVNYGNSISCSAIATEGNIVIKGQELELNVLDYLKNPNKAFSISNGKTITIENAAHSFVLKGNESKATLPAAGTDYKSIGYYFIVNYAHTQNKQVEDEKYFISGDCSTGSVYAKSCECGYADGTLTFTGAPATHSYTSIAAVAATCVKDGNSAYKECNICGKRENYKLISAADHKYEAKSAKAATCTKSGWNEYRVCSVCGESTKAVLPATGHEIIKHAAKPANCTEVGWAAYDSCAKCSYTTYKEIPATGHTMGTVKTDIAASCTNKGVKIATCTVCSSVVRTDVAKKSHTYVVDAAVPATCTKSGKTEGKHCSVCGYVSKAQTTVAKLGHKYADKAVVKATQTKDGKVQSVCSVCGYTKSTSTVVPMIKSVTLSTSTYSYTGSAKKPTVTVKDSKGNKLVKDTDYTVTYTNCTSIGTATAKVSFKGKYSGTKSLDYKIVPGTVTGLKATQTASSITLSWTAVPGAKSYKIYTYSATKKAYIQKTSATTTSCTIKDLKAGTAYTYYVKASKTVDSKVYTGSNYAKISTGTRPANVTGLKATQTTSTVKLSWTKVTNATGYNVYKYDSTAKKYTLVGSSTTTSYTVKSLKAGTSYTYYVKAYKTVNGSMIESASNTKIITGTKTSTPAAPTLTAGTKKVTAKWSKVTGATGYELWMASSKTGEPSKIYSNTGTTYTKSSLTSGKTYYFKVRTYKTVDGKKIYSAYSDIKPVKVK